MKAGGALTQAGQLSGNFSPLQRVLRIGLEPAPAAPAAPAEASQTGEESARAYLNLARGYVADRRTDDAIQAWRQAARLDPANHAAWQDLGVALMQIGRLPDAIGAFRRAIAAKPDFAPAYHKLGMALEAEGNATMAV
jgi:tetratricopeptide (TPR) repeat protein